MIYEKQADKEGHLYFHLYTPDKIARKSYNPTPHFHNSVELVFVRRGSVLVHINGERLTLSEGDIAFVDRLSPHTGSYKDCGGDAEVYAIVASSAYLTEIGWLASEALPTRTERRAGVDKIFELLDWAYPQYDGMNKEMKVGFITLLLGMVSEYTGRTARSSEKNNRLIVDIMIYLNEHFRENISQGDLALRFGYEKTYLSRTFNRLMGMNLREYLNRIRIDAVMKERLKDPDAPIYKIAAECGFENLNTFYRAYNKYRTDL